MSKAIPDRWIPYSCFGKVIEGTRIICFKVPLRKAVLQNCIRQKTIKADDMWDITTLLEKIPKLRFVIDLTNTARYYDSGNFKRAGVEYVKINLPGRVIPSKQCVENFCDTIEDFMQRDGDGLIGVHCTHGLNRTGYMVCRYLRDRVGMPAAQAIDLFENARGYKIERTNYIADLNGTKPPPPDFRKDTVIETVEKSSIRQVENVSEIVRSVDRNQLKSTKSEEIDSSSNIEEGFRSKRCKEKIKLNHRHDKPLEDWRSKHDRDCHQTYQKTRTHEGTSRGKAEYNNWRERRRENGQDCSRDGPLEDWRSKHDRDCHQKYQKTRTYEGTSRGNAEYNNWRERRRENGQGCSRDGERDRRNNDGNFSGNVRRDDEFSKNDDYISKRRSSYNRDRDYDHRYDY